MTATDRLPLETYVHGLIGAVLDRLDLPVVLLDADATILVANGGSEALLADGRHIARTPTGHITCRSIEIARIVTSFLSRLDQPGDDLDLAVHGDGGGAPMFISLSRFAAPAHDGHAAPRPVALLVIRDGSEEEGLEAARIVFGLSDAETSVVRAVVSGTTLRDHAGARGISVHTARKQLSAAMKRAGVSSQLHLQAAIAALMRRPRHGV